jgi:hypothetical protein
MMGTGYGRAISATASQRPSAASESTSSVMTSTMMPSSRVTERGVNALDTSLRNRVWSSPFIASSDVLARSHSGPEVMPWVSRPSPRGTWNRGSRSVWRTDA